MGFFSKCNPLFKTLHTGLMHVHCVRFEVRFVDRHCCVLLSCLKSVTADYISDCVRILRQAIDLRHASEVQARDANTKEGRVKER